MLSMCTMCFLKGVMKVDANTETHSVIQWLDSDSVDCLLLLWSKEWCLVGFAAVELLSNGRWSGLCCLFWAWVQNYAQRQERWNFEL